MNYKNSLTYKINSPKSINQLMINLNELDSKINYKRLIAFSNKNWQKTNKTKADFSQLINGLVEKQSKIKIEEVNELDINKIIDNTLKKFDYLLDDKYSFDFEDNLENFIRNDDVLIIDNNKYSKSLYQMFTIINYHKKLLEEFVKVKYDDTIKLKDKGTAYSSNRDISEIITSIKNYIKDALKLIKENYELEKILKVIEKFEENPYEVIVYISTINENTFEYLKDEDDKKIAEIILKIKKRLNASQGLNEKDFYHSMKYWTITLFPFNETSKYGFSAQDKFIYFLNDLLENIIGIDYFEYKTYDLNVEIQQKDLFNSNPIIEKITATNRKEHPIFDNPKFVKEMKDLIILSLK